MGAERDTGNLVVAIPGASGTLGPAVVRAFADAGASLALAGRDGAKLEALLDAAGLPAGRRLATAVDLLDEGAARAWSAAVQAAFGRVDVVLHLVGGYRAGGAIADIATRDWKELHDMLVGTTLNVARAFAVPLKAGGRGRFIAVTSPKARAPSASSALYAMGKAAADALVLALADELRGTGATANLVEVESIGAPAAVGSEKKPARRVTSPDEIAAAMLYLCSPAAAGINGFRLALAGRS